MAKAVNVAADSNSDDVDDEEDDDGFDLIAAFDSISCVEQELVDEGKTDGQRTVTQRSYDEGYETGKTEGSKLGQELGFYHGFVQYLLFADMDAELMGSKSMKAIGKISKHLNKISLSAKQLTQSEHDRSMKESMQIIRSSFKSLLHSLNVVHDALESLDDNNTDMVVPQTIKQMMQSGTNNATL